MAGQEKKQLSREAAVSIAAGAVTAAAAGAAYYVGGKAALTTIAIVGGGLFALAVTHEVAKRSINGGAQLIAAVQAKIDEHKAREPRPNVRSEHASDEHRGVAIGA